MSGAARMAIWIGAVALAGAQPVRADERVEDLRITYAAPAGCGSADAFFAQLAARAPVKRVESGAVRSFDLTITADARGVHGALAIRAAAGETVRAVEGATCDETIAALVVIASLAVAAERAPAPVVRPPPPPIGRPARTSPPRDRWLAVGSGIGRYSGVLPDPVLAVPVFVALGAFGRAQLRLGFARTAAQETMLAAGASAFRQTIGRLDVRPIALTRGAFELAPAIGVEAGVLTAHGTQVGSPASARRPWIAPDVALRAGAHRGRFALELEAMVAIPLVRDRYYISPGATVHQVPVATYGLGLAAVMEVW